MPDYDYPPRRVCGYELFDNGFWSLHCQKRPAPGRQYCEKHQQKVDNEQKTQLDGGANHPPLAK